MQHSAEVRWFFQGGAPGDVVDWFCVGKKWTVEPAREDRYLGLPSPHVGVKFRAGRFEIKALVQNFGPSTWPGEVRGRGQRWVKWSCAEPPVQGLLDALNANAGGALVGTTKERLLRKYSLDAGGLEEVDAKTARPDKGCNVELTRITTKGAHHWTVGFEAFEYGSKSGVLRIREFLDATVAAFFADPAAACVPRSVSLTNENSRSYPEWLATII